jgi:hypothetical protein
MDIWLCLGGLEFCAPICFTCLNTARDDCFNFALRIQWRADQIAGHAATLVRVPRPDNHLGVSCNIGIPLCPLPARATSFGRFIRRRPAFFFRTPFLRDPPHPAVLGVAAIVGNVLWPHGIGEDCGIDPVFETAAFLLASNTGEAHPEQGT